MSYKLSNVLIAHSADVRNLAVLDNGSFVTVSRDKTAKLWRFNDDNYVEGVKMTGHTNFVSSVCIFNPSAKFPKGLIITGSNDTNLCFYNVGDMEPFHTMKGHENTICGLKKSVMDTNNEFFTCSWDMSVKRWSLDDLVKPKVTYLGHQASAWCVGDLKNGYVISGGADHIVLVYLREGNVLHKLKGHKDCIRDIAIVNDSDFLTCSNDAVIKLWNSVSGVCLHDLYGHENFIYSMDTLPSDMLLISSGEDQCIMVWRNGEIDQKIKLPVQTIWSVKFGNNRDIISAGSDGVVRIFSCIPERHADSETLQLYEESIANFQKETQMEYGGKKFDELPDSSALLQPGAKNGEVKVIREGSSAKAYSWSSQELKWNLVGDVMGSNPASSNRTLHNGQEYDYVFSVDVQEGAPPLKLPFNIGEDPWHAAQKFIHDNNLSQLYLEQVANFIIRNSQQSAPSVDANKTSQYRDPFTGSNRYIPNNSVTESGPELNQQTSNLFTNSIVSSYIPHCHYLKLEQANLSAIHEKLKEFNLKPEVGPQKISENNLKLVVALASNDNEQSVNDGALTILQTLLQQWPDTVMFPLLDIARLSVLHKYVNNKFCTDEIYECVKRHLEKDAISANQMLTFRLLANMFCHDQGEKLCLHHTKEILQAIFNFSTIGNKNNQVAVSTFLLNLTVALNKTKDSSDKVEVLNVMLQILKMLKEPEAIFRILVGLGTFLIKFINEDETEHIGLLRRSDSLRIIHEMSKTCDNSQSKVKAVSKQIIDLLNAS